jgi:hypothetical protein
LPALARTPPTSQANSRARLRRREIVGVAELIGGILSPINGSPHNGGPPPPKPSRHQVLVPTEIGNVQCVPVVASAYNDALCDVPLEVTATEVF